MKLIIFLAGVAAMVSCILTGDTIQAGATLILTLGAFYAWRHVEDLRGKS